MSTAGQASCLMQARSWPLPTLYSHLLQHYGPQHWWPAQSHFEMMLGALLVQNTSWSAAHGAVRALQLAALDSPAALRSAPDESIHERIQGAGYFRQKTKKLKALAQFMGQYQDSPQRLFEQEGAALRATLLTVHGIGPETADCICCYEAGQPWFVVDRYTQRLFQRLGWLDQPWPYETVQQAVHALLPHSAPVLGEFHALIVQHSKQHCSAKPQCQGCPVTHYCAFVAR
ncbi:DNA-3-methyladenine glycosylase III [Magnetococcus marinus MC-1]|uniref:DNA-3-methyladenine glycosylase III n=1 Tax=Magnetococcus marinus (strain ATCC BAA-1437 / JCM 17883 / MC-1) TaxID=156889 RepID=A0L6G4_MAGMM|nr:DNA-3-methyladenine glycosylase III [Magnetococcus marinus]ABK43557.1 DNA-3-methyladenine glycosylase III [Magnetococcus marinus MC-1]